MGKWKQVSGDMNWDGTGCVLAKDNKRTRQVELVKIEPWLELDSSALSDGYEFWCVDTTTLDYEDLGVDRKGVLGAIKSAGMEVDDYKRGDPASKADLVASHQGYEDSRSTSDLLDALPDKPENIEFWGGKETRETVLAHNDEMRREVVQKLAGYRRRGEVPSYDLLKLAMGDKPLTLKLDSDEIQALVYTGLTTSLHDVVQLDFNAPTGKLKIPDAENAEILLKCLGRTAKGSGLSIDEQDTLMAFFAIPPTGERVDRLDALRSEAQNAHDAAEELAETILDKLGF